LRDRRPGCCSSTACFRLAPRGASYDRLIRAGERRRASPGERAHACRRRAVAPHALRRRCFRCAWFGCTGPRAEAHRPWLLDCRSSAPALGKAESTTAPQPLGQLGACGHPRPLLIRTKRPLVLRPRACPKPSRQPRAMARLPVQILQAGGWSLAAAEALEVYIQGLPAYSSGRPAARGRFAPGWDSLPRADSPFPVWAGWIGRSSAEAGGGGRHRWRSGGPDLLGAEALGRLRAWAKTTP